MTVLTVEVQLDNAAFDGSLADCAGEVTRILERMAAKLADGADGGALLDVNGNTVGRWALEPNGRDARTLLTETLANLRNAVKGGDAEALAEAVEIADAALDQAGER